MEVEVDWGRVRSYGTREALLKGLDRYELADCGCRWMVVKTPDDRWTAIFYVGEYVRAHGGYVGFASDKGFMSV